MSNAKYFLLGVGMPEGKEPSKLIAELPWETDLELALPDPQNDFSALQPE